MVTNGPPSFPNIVGDVGSRDSVEQIRAALPGLLAADRNLTNDPSPPGTPFEEKKPYLDSAIASLPQSVAKFWTSSSVSRITQLCALTLLSRERDPRIVRWKETRFDVARWNGIHVTELAAKVSLWGAVDFYGITSNDTITVNTQADGWIGLKGDGQLYGVSLVYEGSWKLLTVDYYSEQH